MSADRLAELERLVADLQRTVSQLQTRDGQPEWLALKSAIFAPFGYQSARSWCEDGKIDAHQDQTRHWYVWNRADRPGHPPSLKSYLARKGLQRRSA